MNQLVPINSSAAGLPVLVAAAGERASMRFLEFFAANIRNLHTRRAYYRAAEEFLAWCASIGIPSIAAVQPVHVAAWIEASTRELAAPCLSRHRHGPPPNGWAGGLICLVSIYPALVSAADGDTAFLGWAQGARRRALLAQRR